MTNYDEKFNQHTKRSLFNYLEKDHQKFIKDLAQEYLFTAQELRLISEITRDFEMWQIENLKGWWIGNHKRYELKGRQLKKRMIEDLKNHWLSLKSEPKDYSLPSIGRPMRNKTTIEEKDSGPQIIGDCPVASDDTVCCNLRTLDVVQSCGFDCSYCSIQSFYSDNKVFLESDLQAKLEEISHELDPNKIHHIGTGQSSDSLMWGNTHGLMDQLNQFARNNDNVVLELKTKSKNIDYLLNNPISSNIITSWSLNTSKVIQHEEHLTATLDERINSAKQVAAKGSLIAFHFHPIVYYQNWEEEYVEIFKRLLNEFHPKQIAFISFGTLTFTKSVIGQIRKRSIYSKILQMNFEDAAGKLSYPPALKEKLFQVAYQTFRPWHSQVFFYLCMEDSKFWHSTFKYTYDNNGQFESDLSLACMEKIKRIRRDHGDLV